MREETRLHASATRRRRAPRASGFSLIELMVVIAILNILAAIVIPNLHRAKARAYVAACLVEMRTLQKLEAMYLGEYGQYSEFLAPLDEFGEFNVTVFNDQCFVDKPEEQGRVKISPDGLAWSVRVTVRGYWERKCWIEVTQETYRLTGDCAR